MMNQLSTWRSAFFTPAALAALVIGVEAHGRAAGDGSRDDVIRIARAEAIARTKAEIEALIERYGGLDEIRYELEPFIEEVLYVIDEQLDNGGRNFQTGGNHFSKALSEVALQPQWEDAVPGKMARDVIIDFDRKLRAQGVDLIVCPVPSKIEAYPRSFETGVPEGIPISVSRLLETLKLLEADVEVVDLLPTLLEAMTEDDAIPVYERSGHHISGIGVRQVAQLIQKRLERYEFEGRDAERFTDEQRTATERVNRSVPMEAWPVLNHGQPYEHVPDSEIVVMGDSHAFAYLTASWACQTARCAGVPITDISVSSGAATAHKRLAGQGLEMLKRRRVVIWVITSVALTRPWEPTEIPERATLAGLIVSGAIDEAIAAVHSGEVDFSALGVSERELDDIGRELLQAPETLQQGIDVLEINTLAFPYSAEAFHSLANAYWKLDEKEKACLNFKKVVALNASVVTRGQALNRIKEVDPEYTPPKEHILTEAAKEALVGEYALTDGARGLVRAENGGLVFEYVGQPVLTLLPISDLRFTTEEGIFAEFTKGEADEPMRVLLSVEGRTFEGPRIQ